MSYYLYIIKSEADGTYYVGTTNDIDNRLERHNQGRSKYTKTRRPWKLVYFEEHPDRSSAMRTESGIKRRKSKEYIKELIKNTTG